MTWRPEQPFRAFASVALATREPRMKTLYDGEEAGSGFVPQFESNGNGGYDTDKPVVREEHLVDLELGAAWVRERSELSVNGFWMEFVDEIVPSGGLDQYGVPRTGNADRTRHTGLEVDASWLVHPMLTVSGNATFSRNRFVEFDEFVFTGAGVERFDRSGNPIAGFPARSGNLALEGRRGAVKASIMSSWVGRQYIDNAYGQDAAGVEQDDLTVDPFVLIDASVRWSVERRHGLEIGLDLNNVLDSQVLTFGNVSVVGPQFFPAATRHLFVSAKVTLR